MKFDLQKLHANLFSNQNPLNDFIYFLHFVALFITSDISGVKTHNVNHFAFYFI